MISSEGALYQHIKFKHPSFNVNEFISIFTSHEDIIMSHIIDAKEKKEKMDHMYKEQNNIDIQENAIKCNEDLDKQSESTENLTILEEYTNTPHSNGQLREDLLKLNLLDNLERQDGKSDQEKREMLINK